MQSKGHPPGHIWTILDILNWTTAFFRSRQIDSPRSSAELLLAHVLKVERIQLYLRHDQPLTPDELGCFKSIIKRRIDREPVAYIIGKKEFWSLELAVSGHCLIPRPETECLVEKALSCLPQKAAPGNQTPWRILELGTGSGAIILAMAHERPENLFFALDLSPAALKAARENARSLHLEDKIQFLAGDWLTPLKSDSCFDMILSNPPYIPSDEIPGLQPEIRNFEPRMALDGGETGLSSLHHIINFAGFHLRPGGKLLLEIGHDQGPGVITAVDDSGMYESVEVIKDYSGYDRVAIMSRKST
jgi:release factor glutamine methyltransferase